MIKSIKIYTHHQDIGRRSSLPLRHRTPRVYPWFSSRRLWRWRRDRERPTPLPIRRPVDSTTIRHRSRTRRTPRTLSRKLWLYDIADPFLIITLLGTDAIGRSAELRIFLGLRTNYRHHEWTRGVRGLRTRHRLTVPIICCVFLYLHHLTPSNLMK